MNLECGRCGYQTIKEKDLSAHVEAHEWLMRRDRCRYSRCFEPTFALDAQHYCTARRVSAPACPLHCPHRRPLEIDADGVHLLVAELVKRATRACDIPKTLYSDTPTSLDGAFTWAIICGQNPWEAAPALLETARRKMAKTYG